VLSKLRELSISHSSARDLPPRTTFELAPSSLLTLKVMAFEPWAEVTFERTDGHRTWTRAQVKVGWGNPATKLWPWLASLGVGPIEVRTPSPKPVEQALAAHRELVVQVVET
jgi:hypothetical protein